MQPWEGGQPRRAICDQGSDSAAAAKCRAASVALGTISEARTIHFTPEPGTTGAMCRFLRKLRGELLRIGQRRAGIAHLVLEVLGQDLRGCKAAGMIEPMPEIHGTLPFSAPAMQRRKLQETSFVQLLMVGCEHAHGFTLVTFTPMGASDTERVGARELRFGVHRGKGD